ncbi:MAG TPA: argininosuccinate lyase [Clostridiales bacterium UBA8960]|jgi:argininosuccinate lyase|nr:argininosuccinate lyase [Clostridiales bacterium UBA8960]
MKLWGGRFKGGSSDLLERFNASIGFDYKLYHEDIIGSIAHGQMLEKIGILTKEEFQQIEKGLIEIEAAIRMGEVSFDIKHEDIHMNIEVMLVERIGPLGKKLHTGRSRNDQVAVDFKMYTMAKTVKIMGQIKSLMALILKLSETHLDVIMPGYTHLQRAQPIRLSFHLMAYFQMLKRDHSRFSDLLERMNELPLGSGALAGVNYENDRELLKDLLGFDALTENAMDAVSDRDFAIEFASASSILMMHLSRFSEELIIWSSSEFKFIEISDTFTTGSSIMPQKKNPDAAELVRGKTGRVYGNLMGILTVMKGLPLAYNKDMQEDKEGIFDTVETVEICLEVFEGMLSETTFLSENMRKAVKYGFLNATDLADYLVKKGLHFRDCHEIAGKLVGLCVDENIALEDLSLEILQSYCPLFEADIYDTLDIETVIENKKSYGSTSKASVLKSIENGNVYLETII